MNAKEWEAWERKLEGRKRPSVIRNVLVGAYIEVEDGKEPRIVSEERADIPVEVWDAYWQSVYQKSTTRKRLEAERRAV